MGSNSCKPDRRKRVIYRPWITDPKTGERRYARDYGRRAWRIEIDDDES